MTENALAIHGVAWSESDPMPLFDSFERARGIKVPDAFISLYRKNNGIKIANDDYDFTLTLKERFGHRDDLRFEGIYSAEDIFLNFNDREGVSFPEGTIPFVCIEQGEICISVRNDSFGQVFFCESDPILDQLPEDSYESALKKFDPLNGLLPGIVLKLSDSLDSFLERITIEEW